MTGLSILFDTTCVTGFIFYFNDNTSQLVGSDYGEIKRPILSLNNLNLRPFLSVNSFVGDAIYRIRMCNEKQSCVDAGDQGIMMNNYFQIEQNLTAFWGSYGKLNGEYRCIKDFGINYLIKL
jgi:hypothetical protein